MSPQNILPKDGETFFFPGFFGKAESDIFLEKLSTEIAWKQEPILIFGKEVMQPRLTAWYGDEGKSYRYSGIEMQPLPWTGSLLEIKSIIEQLANISFNSALLNLYRDGTDSMGWHRDNEKELGIDPVIGSVSFGASRKFLMKHQHDKTLKAAVELTHGSLLLMKGKTQHCWLHSVPKTTKPIGTRINITFRVIV